MITDFLITTIVVTAPDNSILDPAETEPELYPDRQPASEAALRVRFSTGLGGSVVVDGFDSSESPISETFLISPGTTYKHGRTLFSQVTTISVTSPGGNEIDISAFKLNGNPVEQEVYVDSFLGRVQRKPEHKAGELYPGRMGKLVVGDYDLMMLKNPLVKEKQLIYDDRNKYKIEFVPIEITPLHHWVCDLILLERDKRYPTLS